jgi:hypothetical protein
MGTAPIQGQESYVSMILCCEVKACGVHLKSWWNVVEMQVAGNDRSSIILPLSGLKQFHEIVGHFVEITKDRIEGMTGANIRTIDPPRRWMLVIWRFAERDREKKGNGEDYSGFVKKHITLYSVKGLLCHIKVDVWLGCDCGQFVFLFFQSSLFFFSHSSLIIRFICMMMNRKVSEIVYSALYVVNNRRNESDNCSC